MKTMRGITLTALALLTVACEDAPTAPTLEPDSGSGVAESGLESAAAPSQAMVDASLADLPEGTLPTPPVDRDRPGKDRDGTTQARGSDRRAELVVALGAEAVGLATRVTEEAGGGEEVLRFLDHAAALQRRSEAALAAGRNAAAIQLAEAAGLTALKAVVLPDGVTPDDERLLHDLAAALLAQARAAVASDPSPVEAHLLLLAERLFEQGSDRVAAGSLRGLVALWRCAVLSSWLVG